MSPKEALVLTPPTAARERPPVHRCVVPGCRVALPQHLLMCSPHWARVPGALRGRLVEMYRHGQVGTAAHQAVVREALDIIAAAAPASSTQPTLPGVEVKHRGQLVTVQDLAAAAARYAGPLSAQERRQRDGEAQAAAFNAAHPPGSQVRLRDGAIVIVAGPAATFPPSWAAAVAVHPPGEPARRRWRRVDLTEFAEVQSLDFNGSPRCGNSNSRRAHTRRAAGMRIPPSRRRSVASQLRQRRPRCRWYWRSSPTDPEASGSTASNAVSRSITARWSAPATTR